MAQASQVGITFSPRHALHLGLDPHSAYKETLSWPLSVIRLGAYWDEIEKVPGRYDFTRLQWYLQEAQQAGKEILLTVGVKSPRWPEFYFPQHVQADMDHAETQKKLLQFVQKTVESVKDFSCITAWQVENEPLDPSGPHNLVIPFELLQQECQLVRSLDPRPLLITLWGNDLSTRNLLPLAEKLGDAIGLDIYYKQYVTQVLGRAYYRGPSDSDQKLKSLVQRSNKPVWITELQAEPWEKNEEGYRSANPTSFSLEQLQSNWQRAQRLQCEKVLFWGAEYWLWQAQQGNENFTQWIQQLLGD